MQTLEKTQSKRRGRKRERERETERVWFRTEVVASFLLPVRVLRMESYQEALGKAPPAVQNNLLRKNSMSCCLQNKKRNMVEVSI